MEKLKRSLSFRKKKDHVPECSKPHQWQEDERKVREGTCSFQVRYLGCIEVFESRGMQVCEEAVKVLKARKSRSLWSRMSIRRKSKKDKQQCKGKYQRAVLYVSGDALRVVDEISKGLIVDQTIEKVSFCAPDRNHEKGFAYICRDGTTRRWMCHGFLALKESGERLSHAVGCAFAICLERKQKRDKEAGVTVTYNEKGTSFTRTGSFRQTTITERIADPQSALVAEPVPVKRADNPFAVQRPHATSQMLYRQGSFRGFNKLQEASSPFKRQLSLRLNELPSTLERQKAVTSEDGSYQNGPGTVSPIPEASPTKENSDASISQMCQQLTQGLSALAADDPFARAPQGHAAAQVVPQQPVVDPQTAAQPTVPAHPANQVFTRTVPNQHIPEPLRQTNPWASPPYSTGKVSDAEFWLNTTASSVASGGQQDPFVPGGTAVNGTAGQQQQMFASPPPQQVQAQVHVGQSPAQVVPQVTPVAPPPRVPPLSHLRSHSVDTADIGYSWQTQRAPTLRELSQRTNIAQFQSHQNGAVQTSQWSASFDPNSSGQADPFDMAWAARASNKQPASTNGNVSAAAGRGAGSPNPFQQNSTVKTFEVQL